MKVDFMTDQILPSVVSSDLIKDWIDAEAKYLNNPDVKYLDFAKFIADRLNAAINMGVIVSKERFDKAVNQDYCTTCGDILGKDDKKNLKIAPEEKQVIDFVNKNIQPSVAISDPLESKLAESMGADILNSLRPSWDEFNMSLAFTATSRSDDPNIHHGAYICTKDNMPLGFGYNNTISGADPDKIPYFNRDKKRLYMIHAEINAFMNCSHNPKHMDGVKAYVTGTPCINCLQFMINGNIKEIVYAKRAGTITENEETLEVRNNILSMRKDVIYRQMDDLSFLSRIFKSDFCQ